MQFQIPGSPVVVAAASREVIEFDTPPGVASSPPKNQELWQRDRLRSKSMQTEPGSRVITKDSDHGNGQ